MVLEGSTADTILGHQWTSQHSLNVNWNSGEILQWGDSCSQDCLLHVSKRPSHLAVPCMPTPTTVISLNCTFMESPETEHKIKIPPEYRVFPNVFSKQLATQLPPYWPWDCAIDQLPRGTLPKSRIYPLSILEQEAMVEYIEEALQQFI